MLVTIRLHLLLFGPCITLPTIGVLASHGWIDFHALIMLQVVAFTHLP